MAMPSTACEAVNAARNRASRASRCDHHETTAYRATRRPPRCVGHTDPKRIKADVHAPDRHARCVTRTQPVTVTGYRAGCARPKRPRAAATASDRDLRVLRRAVRATAATTWAATVLLQPGAQATRLRSPPRGHRDGRATRDPLRAHPPARQDQPPRAREPRAAPRTRRSPRRDRPAPPAPTPPRPPCRARTHPAATARSPTRTPTTTPLTEHDRLGFWCIREA